MAFCRRVQYARDAESSAGMISMTVYRSVPWMAWGTQMSVDVDGICCRQAVEKCEWEDIAGLDSSASRPSACGEWLLTAARRRLWKDVADLPNTRRRGGRDSRPSWDSCVSRSTCTGTCRNRLTWWKVSSALAAGMWTVGVEEGGGVCKSTVR